MEPVESEGNEVGTEHSNGRPNSEMGEIPGDAEILRRMDDFRRQMATFQDAIMRRMDVLERRFEDSEVRCPPRSLSLARSGSLASSRDAALLAPASSLAFMRNRSQALGDGEPHSSQHEPPFLSRIRSMKMSSMIPDRESRRGGSENHRVSSSRHGSYMKSEDDIEGNSACSSSESDNGDEVVAAVRADVDGPDGKGVEVDANPGIVFTERLKAVAGKERLKRGLDSRRNQSKEMLDDLTKHGRSMAVHNANTMAKLQLRYSYSINSNGSAGGVEGDGSHSLRWLFAPVIGVLQPFSCFCVVWHSVLLLTCSASLVFLPFWTGFGMIARSHIVAYWFKIILLAVYLADILMSFRTSFLSNLQGCDSNNNGMKQQGSCGLVKSHAAIATHYAKTWLVPDILMLLAAVLGVLIEDKDFVESTGGLHRWWLLSILNLLVLVKWIKVLASEQQLLLYKQANQRLGSSLYQLLLFILCMLILIHWTACIFHYISLTDNFSESSWVRAQGLDDASEAERYVEALYWALSTLTTVGYGDVSPVNVAEKLFTILAMTLGISAFAYLIGNMSTMVMTMNHRRTQESIWTSKMEDFVQRNNVPRDLARRLRLYHAYIMHRALPGADQDIVDSLSGTLRMQTMLYLGAETISKLPELNKVEDPRLVSMLVDHLELSLHAPGDIVMLEGELSTEMWFLGEGLMEVWISAKNFLDMRSTQVDEMALSNFLNKHGAAASSTTDSELCEDMITATLTHRFYKVGELEGGDVFGQISALKSQPKICSASAATCCEVYMLSVSSLESILDLNNDLSIALLRFVSSITEPSINRANCSGKVEAAATRNDMTISEWQNTIQDLVSKASETPWSRSQQKASRTSVLGLLHWGKLRSQLHEAKKKMKLLRGNSLVPEPDKRRSNLHPTGASSGSEEGLAELKQHSPSAWDNLLK